MNKRRRYSAIRPPEEQVANASLHQRADLIKQIKILTVSNTLLRASLKEVCDELEARIEQSYAHTKGYPAMQRRYRRDMRMVEMARTVLNETKALEAISNAI